MLRFRATTLKRIDAFSNVSGFRSVFKRLRFRKRRSAFSIVSVWSRDENVSKTMRIQMKTHYCGWGLGIGRPSSLRGDKSVSIVTRANWLWNSASFSVICFLFSLSFVWWPWPCTKNERYWNAYKQLETCELTRKTKQCVRSRFVRQKTKQLWTLPFLSYTTSLSTVVCCIVAQRVSCILKTFWAGVQSCFQHCCKGLNVWYLTLLYMIS